MNTFKVRILKTDFTVCNHTKTELCVCNSEGGAKKQLKEGWDYFINENRPATKEGVYINKPNMKCWRGSGYHIGQQYCMSIKSYEVRP